MIRSRAIVYILGVLLFLFLNSNAHTDKHLTYVFGHISAAPHLPGRVNANTPPDGHYFSKHIIKRYDIKVRYMGSACSYCAAPVFISYTPVFPDVHPFAADNRLVISKGSHFLFSLRGPPCEAVTL